MLFVTATESKLRRWPSKASVLTLRADPERPRPKCCVHVVSLIHLIYLKLSKLALCILSVCATTELQPLAQEGSHSVGCVVFMEILAILESGLPA